MFDFAIRLAKSFRCVKGAETATDENPVVGNFVMDIFVSDSSCLEYPCAMTYNIRTKVVVVFM